MGSKTPLALFLILATLASLFALSACGKGEKIDELDEPVVLCDASNSYYTLVTPEGTINPVLDCMEQINAYPASKGAVLTLTDEGDHVSDGAGRLEILIGTAKSPKMLDAVSAFCDTYLHTFYSDTLNFAEGHRSVGVAYTFSDRLEMAPGSDIRVMSFNVLCELWDTKAADYHARANTAVAVVKKYAPHVVGLQEMSDNYHIKVKALFGEDYKIIDEKNEKGQTNFSPLAYNTEKVTLMDHGMQIFSQGNNTKLRLAAWAVFLDKDSGKQFVVVNTHWDLGENVEYRKVHANEMAQVVNKLKNKYKCPVITTGEVMHALRDEIQRRHRRL